MEARKVNSIPGSTEASRKIAWDYCHLVMWLAEQKKKSVNITTEQAEGTLVRLLAGELQCEDTREKTMARIMRAEIYKDNMLVMDDFLKASQEFIERNRLLIAEHVLVTNTSNSHG